MKKKDLTEKTKLIDIAISFQIAGMICALLGNIVWEKGVLDFIYLKPLFVFDLKDLYLNCFVVLIMIYVYKHGEELKKAKLKDIIHQFRNK